jgi:hypothetical protein
MIDDFTQKYSGMFDSDELKLLSEAFAEAWATARKNGAFANGFSEDARTILAEQIIRQAIAGERDKLVLLDGALKYLRRTALPSRSPPESFSYKDRVPPLPSPLPSFSRRVASAWRAWRSNGRPTQERPPHSPNFR